MRLCCGAGLGTPPACFLGLAANFKTSKSTTRNPSKPDHGYKRYFSQAASRNRQSDAPSRRPGSRAGKPLRHASEPRRKHHRASGGRFASITRRERHEMGLARTVRRSLWWYCGLLTSADSGCPASTSSPPFWQSLLAVYRRDLADRGARRAAGVEFVWRSYKVDNSDPPRERSLRLVLHELDRRWHV